MSDDWKTYKEPLQFEPPVKNPLPNWEPLRKGYVNAPLHVMRISDRACVFCGEGPIWTTYEEYVDHFYKYEYEGERHHVPGEEGDYYLVASLCLG